MPTAASKSPALDPQKIRVALIGVGAIGGLYGGLLQRAGCDVTYLARSDAQHLAEHGLRVDTTYGDFHLPEVRVIERAEDFTPCDLVLLCTKTTANDRILDLVRPAVGPESTVVLMQNGMGFERPLAEALPATTTTTILAGLCFVCSDKVGPGHIQHVEYGRVSFGFFSGDTAKLDWAADLFELAGIETERLLDGPQARWRKLVWNAPYNALCVILNTNTAALMGQPHTRHVIREIMTEVRDCAIACGHGFEEEFIQKMAEHTDNMQPYVPSMKHDFDANRPLEIEALYERPAAMAAQAGADPKYLKLLAAQLRFLEAIRKSPARRSLPLAS